MNIDLTYKNWIDGLYEIEIYEDRTISPDVFFIPDENPPKLRVIFQIINIKEQNLIKQKQASLHKYFVNSSFEYLKKKFESRDFQLSSKVEVIQNEIIELKKYFFSDFEYETKDFEFKIADFSYEYQELNKIKNIITDLRRGFESKTDYIASPTGNYKFTKVVVAEAIVKYLKWLESMIIHEDINSLHESATNHENLKNVEVLIYLNELGIIDYLRKFEPFKTSNNKTALILSKITKSNHSSLYPNINAILKNDFDDKNHPYNTKKNVKRIQMELEKMGFSGKMNNF